MKRYSAIRVFVKSLEPGDIGIFIGDGLCKEAFVYERPGNLYLPSYDNMISLSLGMAMCTNKRVFIFCDDNYLIKNMSEIAQIAVSKCSNIYLIVLVSGYYMDIGKFPTIYNSITAPQNVMFNMGFIVHNYTRHFKNIKNTEKEINAIWRKAKGPLAGVVNLDFGLKKIESDYPSLQDSLRNLVEFIKNEEIPAYSYALPPNMFDVKGEE